MDIESDFISSWKNLSIRGKIFFWKFSNKDSFGEGTIFDGFLGSESRQPTQDEFKVMLKNIISTVKIENNWNHEKDIKQLLWFRNIEEISLSFITLKDNFNLELLSTLPKLKKLKLEGYIRFQDLSFFTNLKELSVETDRYVVDLEPISLLHNLEKLELEIKSEGNYDDFDITSLCKLKNLTELSIYSNHSNDLSPLKNLSKLKVLKLNYIDCNKPSRPIDISFIGNLDLKVLIIYSNSQIDYQPVSKNINLEELTLQGGQINLDLLIPLKKIKYLKVIGNKEYDRTENIIGLNHLTELEYLFLDYYSHRLEIDFSFLSKNQKLKKLRLFGPNPSENHLSFVSELHSLKDLVIGDNKKIDDLSFLEKLTNLCCLSLINLENLTTLKSISSLKNLKFLKLTNSPLINDISPIGELSNLENLEISGLEHIIGAQELVKLKSIKRISTNNSHENGGFFIAKSNFEKEASLKLYLEKLKYLVKR